MAAIILVWPSSIHAGIFPGNALASAADSSGDLSYNPPARTPAPNALTVSCWFKISVPSGTNITQNMTLLVNRRTGDENSPFAYLVQFNATTGNVEFSARGTSTFTGLLVQRPYLDRWYHVAVVRSGLNFTGYLDGRQVFSAAQDVGSSANTDGVSIGGWNGSRFLYGEVMEAAIYQAALSQELIVSLMFADQQPAALPDLRGYYKLAYATNAADNLKNFATTPAAGTDPLVKQGSGTLTFEEANTGDEQSLFDSRKNGGRDALTPLSGTFSWQQAMLSRPTTGVPFEFRIGYRSGNAFNSQVLGSFDPFASSVFSSGWRHTFDVRVVPSQYFSPISGLDSVGLMLWDGSLEVWDYNTNTQTYAPRHNEYRGEFRIPNASICEWITSDRLIYRFYHPFSGASILRGRLKEIEDMSGNKLSVAWDATLGRITKVTDAAGADWTFTYNAQNLLTSVVGLGWTLTFTYDANNRLAAREITSFPAAYTTTPALNTKWQFAYDGTTGLLNNITDPRGISTVRIAYDKYGRKTSVQDGLGRTAQADYNLPASRQLTSTDPAGKKWIDTFDRRSRLLSRKDPLGNTTSSEYDTNGNISKTTDALGRITQFTYDARANVLTKTDALGKVWQWQYDHVLTGGIAWNQPTKNIQPPTDEAPAGWENRFVYDAATGSLLRHEDDLGTLVSYTYNAKGLVQTSKDAGNHTTSFSYSPEGFMLSRTDAAGQTTTYSRSEFGWTLSETNPLSQTTSYLYNVNGQAVQITDALSRTLKKTYDSNGNLLGQTDAKNQQTSYVYDAENQRISMTDRAGQIWTYSYNSRSMLETTRDPSLPGGSGATLTKTYDDGGRLVTETDPLGHFTAYEYDAAGNQTAKVDKAGQRWRKTYDALNRTTIDTDPLGNSILTAYDAAGRIKTTTSPSGFTQTHEYDGRGRLSRWTDAQGFRWLYGYDGVGNILDIEDALHGHYVMTYGPRNERLTERDQDGKLWTYTYDELLRLKTQADPNGVVRTLTYDAAGRATAAAFSTGRSHTITYDLNSNPLTITRASDGVTTTTTLTYDAMDRAATSTDTYGQTLGYSFDPVGRVKTITYPGAKTLTRNYDAAGRLTTITDWATRVSTFTYDNADRLTSRSYPNGLTQTLAYDSASRVTDLQHKQGGTALIALSYAYDANGNKTSALEQGLMSWTPPPSYDETARYTAAGRLIDRTDAADATHGKDFRYQYDNSGNMTQATSSTQTYLLTYDEDNRVLSVGWNQAPQSRLITNRYDALGRRISRILDGTETRYVLDLSSGMERILCDTDASGTIRTRYVHASELCYKEDAQTGAITCYHADAQANIVRTSDATGATINEYSYTPYGRSLGSTGASTDPYRFVGSQGVMEEMPNLYFMRARYYSAEAGVFLSTDPVKKIGAGWRPEAYEYSGGNPTRFIDPSGNRYSNTQILRIQQAQQQAYEYQMDAIYWDARADILQGVYDSLQTTKSLFEADAVGVYSNLVRQIGGLSEAMGNRNAGSVMRLGADVADAYSILGDIYSVTSNIGQVERRLNELTERSNPLNYVNQLAGRDTIYGKTMVTPMKEGMNFFAEGTGNAIYHPASASQASSSSGGGGGGGYSFSSGSVRAASIATSMNSVQSVMPQSTPMMISTSGAASQKSSGASSVGQSLSSTISKALSSVTSAVKSIYSSIVSFFKW